MDRIGAMNWIIDNKEWLFSGIGIVVLGAVLKFLWKRTVSSLKQKGGKNSVNVQVGGNIVIRKGNGDDKK